MTKRERHYHLTTKDRNKRLWGYPESYYPRRFYCIMKGTTSGFHFHVPITRVVVGKHPILYHKVRIK